MLSPADADILQEGVDHVRMMCMHEVRVDADLDDAPAYGNGETALYTCVARRPVHVRASCVGTQHRGTAAFRNSGVEVLLGCDEVYCIPYMPWLPLLHSPRQI